MMKRLLLLMLACAPAAAQEQWGFSGYVFAFPTFSQLATDEARLFGIDRFQRSGIARVRLRPEYSPWENTRIALEYELSAFWHSASVPFGGMSSDPSRQIVPLRWTLTENRNWAVRHFVDRLYVEQNLPGVDMTVGRQRIAWGSGRIWNPSDLFNPLNPATLGKIEKDGVDAALAKVRLGNFSDVSLVWNPQKGWTHNNAGARIRLNAGGVDVAALGGSFDDRFVAGLDVAGSVLDAGVRLEATWTRPPLGHGDSFLRAVVGADYQFTADVYGLVEYYFNGEGRKYPFQYEMLRLLHGEILNVATNYVAAGTTILVHPLVSVSATAISNCDDRSAFLNLSATVSVTDELSLALGGQVFTGKMFDEYWYYPSTVSMKADWYF